MSVGHRMATLPPRRPEMSPGGDAVFVQVARGMSYAADVLVLADLAPSTIYLSVAQPTEVGYLSTGDFLDRWSRWERDHEDGRTHGVLSLLDVSARVTGDAHVLLHRPRIHGAGLAYPLELIHGVIPSSSGSCVLVLEPHATPSTS